MKKIKLTIEGMHCASCTANIQKALMNIRGVKSVNASVLFKSGKVEMEDSVNPEDIKKTIAKLGYKVISLKEE